MSAPAALGVLLLFCLYLALYHGAFAALLALVADPGSPLSRRALLSASFLWVAVELARTRITGFPWDLLGTVQVDNIPLARIARFTGVYGLSFEIMLVNTAFATAFLVRRDKRKTLLIAGLCAEGTSTIANAAEIDRGYERIDERLRALGASIERI